MGFSTSAYMGPFLKCFVFEANPHSYRNMWKFSEKIKESLYCPINDKDHIWLPNKRMIYPREFSINLNERGFQEIINIDINGEILWFEDNFKEEIEISKKYYTMGSKVVWGQIVNIS